MIIDYRVSLQSNLAGVNIIPNASSAKILDIFEIYKEKFNLEFELDQPRIGEKIHEIMASEEEVRRMKFIEDLNLYILDPKKEYNQLNFINDTYSSRDFCLEREALSKTLESNNYFKCV